MLEILKNLSQYSSDLMYDCAVYSEPSASSELMYDCTVYLEPSVYSPIKKW